MKYYFQAIEGIVDNTGFGKFKKVVSLQEIPLTKKEKLEVTDDNLIIKGIAIAKDIEKTKPLTNCKKYIHKCRHDEEHPAPCEMIEINY